MVPRNSVRTRLLLPCARESAVPASVSCRIFLSLFVCLLTYTGSLHFVQLGATVLDIVPIVSNIELSIFRIERV